MENRSRLAHTSVGAGLLVLLLVWPARCIADQSAPAVAEQSLSERANDPTATLTQLQVKDEYTPAEYGTNAQLKHIDPAGHSGSPSPRTTKSRTDNSADFSDRDQAAGKGCGDPHRVR